MHAAVCPDGCHAYLPAAEPESCTVTLNQPCVDLVKPCVDEFILGRHLTFHYPDIQQKIWKAVPGYCSLNIILWL